MPFVVASDMIDAKQAADRPPVQPHRREAQKSRIVVADSHGSSEARASRDHSIPV